MNEIKIFSNPQFGEIRTLADEANEPLFCLADLCAALGISNHRNVKARLDEDDVRLMDTADSLGRRQQVIYVTESGMYDVILRSDAEKAKPFRKWVTSDVIPTIRKTGGYLATNADDTPEMIMARAVLVAQATIEKQNKQIEEQQKLLLAQGEQIAERDRAIAELHERTSYLDQILQSKSTVTTTQIAQDYGMSAKKFNIELRNLKIQRKVGGQWILYAPYNTMGYVHSETFIPDNSTTGKVIMISRWTQKGRLLLYEILKKNGVLPLIER